MIERLKAIFNNHIGYTNRITRQELCRKLGCSDSAMRMAVAELRLTDIKIVSHNTMKGYFRIDPARATAEDYQHYDAYIADLSTKLKTQQAILESQAIDQFRLLEVN